MGAFRRRVNSALSAYFPEKRLFIQSGNSTRYIRLTPLSQFMSGAASLAMVGWMAVATATVAIDFVGGSGTTHAVVIQKAYEARLEELASERDQRAGEARSAQTRFQTAMKQISRQQTALLQSVEQRRELTTAVDLMRQRLQDAVGQRDAVTRRQRPAAGADERREREAERRERHRLRRDAEDGLGRALRGGGGARRGERGAGGADPAGGRPRAPDEGQHPAPGRDGRPAGAGGRHVLRAAGEADQDRRPRRGQPDRDGQDRLFRPGRAGRRRRGQHAGRSTIRRSTAGSTS